MDYMHDVLILRGFLVFAKNSICATQTRVMIESFSVISCLYREAAFLFS